MGGSGEQGRGPRRGSSRGLIDNDLGEDLGFSVEERRMRALCVSR